jgi:PAS domain-containing protein
VDAARERMIRLLLSWLYRRLYPAGEALRASEARYADLFARVPDGVYETLPDGTVVAANPALVRMLGYASEDEMKAAGGAAQLYVRPELSARSCGVTWKAKVKSDNIELRSLPQGRAGVHGA